MSEAPTIVATDVMRRSLREQPVLRIRGLWDPSNPDSGAGAALGEVNAEVQRQGLTQAGSVYICVGEPTDDGLIPGEAVIPVDRPAESRAAVEAVTLPATEAVSALYRDNIHLTAGKAVVQRLREYAEHNGLALEGEPRWIYHTSPDWNLEPNDHLIEVVWPTH
jgi:effector-binding domain-containing protein